MLKVQYFFSMDGDSVGKVLICWPDLVENPDSDFHWAVELSDGRWAHKMGSGDAEILDSEEALIARFEEDPRYGRHFKIRCSK